MSAPPEPAGGDAPRRLFADRARYPLNYSLMQPMDGSGTPVRMAQSSTQRARGYLCNGFYKPISRCFLLRSPAPGGGDG